MTSPETTRIQVVPGWRTGAFTPPEGALRLPDNGDGNVAFLLNAGQVILNLASKVDELEARLDSLGKNP